jgi:hypothetical protein
LRFARRDHSQGHGFRFFCFDGDGGEFHLKAVWRLKAESSWGIVMKGESIDFGACPLMVDAL